MRRLCVGAPHLHDCVSDRAHAVAVPDNGFHIDALVADAPLIGGLQPRLGGKALRVISVRSFVTATEPGLLDALNRLPLGYRWVTRFLPLSREEGRHEIEKIRKRWFSKRKGLLTLLREALFREEALLVDNDATNQAANADAALQELGAEAVAAGFATITITIAENDDATADEAVRLVQQITDGLGFVTQVENVNAVEAWLGSLPGQAYADVRRPIVLTPSLSHLMPLSAVWASTHRIGRVRRRGRILPRCWGKARAPPRPSVRLQKLSPQRRRRARGFARLIVKAPATIAAGFAATSRSPDRSGALGCGAAPQGGRPG